ncbi:S-layer homology domain-containing protein [Paenibacillus glycanilyticus]|uniref:S-layer homology domain-containing protein n=1 Tax=Paenibacillus glycanilyticus TaxID=126569 RepID=UPI002042332A|nr:S-layer homology domain-containing protein [Paenibacillus glycanilyticus]MCM3630504.1 S-layer homology domain-containing protein [Paenibacillus glycanilyticus]
MRKAWVSIVLASVVAAGSIVGLGLTGKGRSVEAAAKPSFTDIKGHWAESSIETAVQAGVLNGYADGTYKPNNTITRAELLKVVAMTFKIEVGTGGSTWYAPYQTALSKAGVYIEGDYSGNLNNPATRNEMAKLAVRGEYAEYRGKKLSAAELMFRAVNKGILSRSGTKAETINTEGTTTRAEAAVLVTRLLKLADGGKLTVDQGASSAAEIAWHRHNMITMFDQNDLVKLPYSVDISKKYNVTIDKLIILDPADTKGYYAEYLKGATYFPANKLEKPKDVYLFAYKIIGKNLVADGSGQVMRTSFEMYTEGKTGTILLDTPYVYDDGKLIEREGLFYNNQEFGFHKVDSIAHNYVFKLVPKNYIQDQIKQYGGVPIHLERYNVAFGKQSQFYLTDVKDKWAL